METVGLSCPINGTKVNETVVRLVAAQVVVLIGVSVLTGFYWLTALVLFDFALRAFAGGKGSMLKSSAKWIADTFKLLPKQTDEAPKLFAAKIGFTVLVGLLALQFFGQTLPVWIVGAGLITFAVLESVFAICVGCILYQQLNRFRSIDSI